MTGRMSIVSESKRPSLLLPGIQRIARLYSLPIPDRKPRHLRARFFLCCLLLCILLPTGKASAMTLEELAEVCAAQEAAIQDVYVEYEWGRDPPYTTKDITGQVVAVPTGPRKITWATARPFEDRFLWIDSAEWIDAQNNRSQVTETRSYNGEVGKHLELRGNRAEGGPSARGTITKSRRFILSGSTTPERFTVVRFRREQPDYPLAEALRKTEWVDLIDEVQQIGPFRTIRADFYAEGVKDEKGNRVPLSRVHFSIDHGYTPVQFELFNARKLVMRDVVTELVQAAPGVWYPKSANTTEFERGDTGYTFTCRASKILVNQGLSPQFFDIDFPPGTKIIDEILNSEYIIRPTEDQFKKWLETEEVLKGNRRTSPDRGSVAPSKEARAAITRSGTLDPGKDDGERGDVSPLAIGHHKSGKMRMVPVVIRPFLLGLSLLTVLILGLRRWFWPREGRTGDSK